VEYILFGHIILFGGEHNICIPFFFVNGLNCIRYFFTAPNILYFKVVMFTVRKVLCSIEINHDSDLNVTLIELMLKGLLSILYRVTSF
jgi:hypothetical protein